MTSAAAIHESLLDCDIVGLHTDRYVRAFLHCCDELTDGEVDFATRTVRFAGPRGAGARLPDLGRPGRVRAAGGVATRCCAEEPGGAGPRPRR